MKFAFSTNAYRNFSLEDSIESIASVGYSAIELMCDEPHAFPPVASERIDSIKQSLIKNKMQISNLNGFMMCAIKDFHHPSWIESDKDFRQKRIEHTKNCIILAKELGAKSVSTEPGGPSNGSSKEELDLFEKGVREILPIAEECQVKFLIEPEPGLLIEKSDQFRDFISRFDSDFVGLNFDVGHFFCVGEDPAKLICDFSDQIRHVHLEDIASSRFHKHLIPGTGAINFSEIFEALKKINYDGFVTVELYPYLENPMDAAKKALNYLQPLAYD